MPLSIKEQHRKMRLAINDVELAMSGMDMGQFLKDWEGASDKAKVYFTLGQLRQLARCYPKLNYIMNSEDFTV